MKCWYCNNEVDNDSMFCKYCGKQLVDEDNLVRRFWISIGLFIGSFVISLLFLIFCDKEDTAAESALILQTLFFGVFFIVIIALFAVAPKKSKDAQFIIDWVDDNKKWGCSINKDDRDQYRTIKRALLANTIILCIIGLFAFVLIGVGIFYLSPFNETYSVIGYCVGVSLPLVPAAVISLFLLDS